MTKNQINNLNLGKPFNGQLWFQNPTSTTMEGIINFQLETMFFWIFISILVLYGLAGSKILFKEHKHKFSSRVSHHTLLERIYSALPMAIIVCLYAPHLSLLYAIDDYQNSNICIKIVGRQWYWHYEVNFNNSNILSLNNYNFDSYGLSDKTIKSNYIQHFIKKNELITSFNNKSFIEKYNNIYFEKNIDFIKYDTEQRLCRLLETTRSLILPTNMIIRMLITGADVIHSFSIPSLGIKTDAIPGRLNQLFITITQEGLFNGQCSELCGEFHFAMPIVIQSIHPEYI